MSVNELRESETASRMALPWRQGPQGAWHRPVQPSLPSLPSRGTQARMDLGLPLFSFRVYPARNGRDGGMPCIAPRASLGLARELEAG
jgi:hypothetical protein